MKYKPGDRVRIVSKWSGCCHQNKQGNMDLWLGKVMTIRECCDDFYYMEEDKNENAGTGWLWYEEAIVGFAEDEKIEGLGVDEPLTENEHGGKQSDSPYGFHMLPAHAVFAAAKTAKYGADKYGETFDDRNYTKIPPEDHVNHAVQHLYAYLAGDRQDEHLAHAIVRTMFAYETDYRRRA